MMTATTKLGHEVHVGDVVGFEKTVAKNRVLIYGTIDDISFPGEVTIKTAGYKGNPNIDKKKFKPTYTVNEDKCYAMEVAGHTL